jgi:hypothetical protein
MSRRARSEPPVRMFDRAAWEPEFTAGVDLANRVIETDPGRVDFSLSQAEAQLAAWPPVQVGNGLRDDQYATTRGFAETLREYRQDQAS